jgi:hypothetical protein
MTLNIENFDKLYGYVDALPDDGEPRGWSFHDCFAGMIHTITDGKEYDLALFLDIDRNTAQALFYMRAADGGNFMLDFPKLSAAKQKVVMLDVLRTLRQEGRVAWDKAFTLVTDGAV